MTPNKPSLANEKGAALIMGLIFLVMLTLLGVSAMQSAGLDERMAGNRRAHIAAIQTSEATLREAKFYAFVKEPSAYSNACAMGLCTFGNAPDPSTYAWDGSKSISYGVAQGASPILLPGVAVQPQYFVEHIGKVKASGVSNGDPEGFRVSAMGTSGDGTARVILQEVFAIKR